MYFPYLRGKQFELLALRELAPRLGREQQVTPIIEPVRAPGDSGIDRCVTSLLNVSLDFILIANPTVGELRSNDLSPAIVDYVVRRDLGESWNIGLIIQEGFDPNVLVQNFRQHFGTLRRLSLIHLSMAIPREDLPAIASEFRRGYDIISENINQRHVRGLPLRERGVTLHDGFMPEKRNAAYIDRQETMFSEDHLYYKDEGWFGFGDFLTIGFEFTEGGFSPRAVAIHWTYEPAPGAPIMIRSFTSNTNGDIGNAGGKFLEAAGKLVAFLDQYDITTDAANIMRSHVHNQTYPGLGVVKKLSILNHLQLISGILSRR
jgi:hypothetical protein